MTTYLDKLINILDKFVIKDIAEIIKLYLNMPKNTIVFVLGINHQQIRKLEYLMDYTDKEIKKIEKLNKPTPDYMTKKALEYHIQPFERITYMRFYIKQDENTHKQNLLPLSVKRIFNIQLKKYEQDI